MTETISYPITDQSTQYVTTRGGEFRIASVSVKETFTPDDKSFDNGLTLGAQYRMSRVNTASRQAKSVYDVTPLMPLANDNLPGSQELIHTRRELRQFERTEYKANHRLRRFGSRILEIALQPFVK